MNRKNLLSRKGTTSNRSLQKEMVMGGNPNMKIQYPVMKRSNGCATGYAGIISCGSISKEAETERTDSKPGKL